MTNCGAGDPATGAGPNSFVGVPAGKNFAGDGVTPAPPPSVTEFSGVVAGTGNLACASATGILSGYNNQVGNGDFLNYPANGSVIGGGNSNFINIELYGFIGGGASNLLQGTTGTGFGSGIVAGYQNTNRSSTAFIGAGSNNQASLNYTYTQDVFIGAGSGNIVNSSESSVVGGVSNSVLGSGAASAIVGGESNVTQARQDFIGGGYDNQITLTTAGGANGSGLAVIDGGSYNVITSPARNGGYFGVIGGGTRNTVTGTAATVPGGSGNTAGGADSFAAGTGSDAKNDGGFVFSDDAAGARQLSTTGVNQFLVRASGGFALYSSAGLTSGVVLRAGSGSWASLSDRASKTNVIALDPDAVLAKVAALPVSEWSYRTEDAAIRHVGPMAQDFYAAFGVGADNRHITSIDEDGVALAAIKALSAKNAALEVKLRLLAARDAKLESAVAALIAAKR